MEPHFRGTAQIRTGRERPNCASFEPNRLDRANVLERVLFGQDGDLLAEATRRWRDQIEDGERVGVN
jgi:hypothetical protein